MKTMKIGSFVWHSFNGLLRFGTVSGKTIDKKGWAHYTVVWHDDTGYQYVMNTEGTPALATLEHQYRVDELTLVDTEHLSRALSGHTRFSIPRPKPEIPVC